MTEPRGPGGVFTTLFDEQADLPALLPEPFRRIYGDLRMPERADRPYTFINFVTSRDGRVSFNEPGQTGGGEVSGFSAPDQWLMALLRARADAVMMGEGTLRSEPHHLWTSEFIYPPDAEAFIALRRHLGLSPTLLHVFLSLEGELPADAAVFGVPDLPVLVATTAAGKARAEGLLRGCAARVEALALGDTAVDLAELMRLLRGRYGVRALLCEGGPRVYGSMLRAGLVDEEFLTLSPIVIGEEPGRPRPSLVEGAGFAPGAAPRSTLLSLRRVGNHLFMRSRWEYPGEGR